MCQCERSSWCRVCVLILLIVLRKVEAHNLPSLPLARLMLVCAHLLVETTGARQHKMVTTCMTLWCLLTTGIWLWAGQDYVITKCVV